jgi:hypothetical protein
MFDNDVKLASIRIADFGRWIKLGGDSDGACEPGDILTLNFTSPVTTRDKMFTPISNKQNAIVIQ